MEADMQTKTYKVLREHIGDEGKLYSPNGEFSTREANPNEVAHLIPLTLEEIVDEPAAADAGDETDDAGDDAADGDDAAETATNDAAPENKAEVAPETAAQPAPARKGK
jgi:hypothetical protein